VNGTWGDAIQVPGTGSNADVTSVSCPSAGNCAAGGSYVVSSSSGVSNQAFVASEVSGTWGDAIQVPGSAALNTGNNAEVTSVSCGSAGNCAAGGEYYNSDFSDQAFVASEVNGTWGDAIQVPGSGSNAEVTSVSCPSAGSCAAGGYYYPGVSGNQAFVVSQVNGTWGEAIEVPGTAALSDGGEADVTSVSCPQAGSCAAGGQYADVNSDILQAFVASQN
jgi:hypothetical protein